MYKYFGEKTVQINKCSLSTVHATITDKVEEAAKTVSTEKWPNPELLMRSMVYRLRTHAVADAHQTGPDQLLMNVKTPTANTLYPLTPLYALDRSTEEIAFVPPNAKKDEYCMKSEVKVSSRGRNLPDRFSKATWI